MGNNYKQNNDYFKLKNIPLIILGVYHYKENLIFVDFDTTYYSNNKSNNSSAHVLSSDLQLASINGFHSKVDIKENKITIFTPENTKRFLDYKFETSEETQNDIINVFDNFFDTLEPKWDGVECYKEMFKADYSKKREAEWPGYYLEYKFDTFVKKNNYKDIVCLHQDKRQDGIDLDLYFPKIKSFGDLKCHSNSSSAILGNSKEAIANALKNGSVYYFAVEHDTTKDSDLNYKTTIYWNKLLNKDNLMSYSKRMKGKIKILSYLVLEINKYNYHYLSDFQHGFKNSNGKSRKTKISIKTRDISNFIIYKRSLK